MEVGGIAGELFSYLFFIISLFVMIMIKFLWYKFFKVNMIGYYKIIILFIYYFLIIQLLIMISPIQPSVQFQSDQKTDNQPFYGFFCSYLLLKPCIQYLRHLITHSCPDLLFLQINSIIMKKKFQPSNLFNYYNNENFKSKVDVSLVRWKF